ncbi:MAG: hypothetical protein WC551_10890 [Patescibacteria group bacterium]
MIPSPLQYGFLNRPVGGSWTPAQLASPPSFWLDYTSTVTDAGGGACSQWNDISGNAWHVTQSSAGARPTIIASGLNGKRTISFDGTADLMTRVNADIAALYQNQPQGWQFFVLKKNATDSPSTSARQDSVNITATGGSRFSLGMNGNGVSDKAQIVVRRLDADSAGILIGATTLTTAFNIHMATMDWSAGDGTLYLNGTQDAQNLTLTSSGNTSNTAAAGNVYYLGQGTNFTNSQMFIVMLGRTIPSTVERQKLEGWAAWAGGLQANLPVDHPYKFFAP